MLLTFRSHGRRLSAVALFAVSLFLVGGRQVRAQAVAGLNPDNDNRGHSAVRESSEVKSATPEKTPEKKPETTEEKLSALEQMLLEQGQRLNQLQQTIAEQQETIRLLASKLTAGEHSNAASGPTTSAGTPGATGLTDPGATVATQPAPPSIDSRLKKVEDRVADIGAIKIDGDIRVREESFFGLSNNLANGDTPTAFGNDLSSRNRFRMRARLRMSGGFGEEFDCGSAKCKEFEWGLRLATGSLADNISTNQTLTDFFARKPFALDQAFISYRPVKFGGRLQLQGGKFEAPWVARFEAPWPHPELMFDNDLMVEGFAESYTHTSKTSSLRELKFVAWQLPFLERNAAFVRNANGTVNITESRRGGRDLALYGGQIRARWELSPKVAFHLSAADLYYSGTQFISPVQVFGSQLLLPLTFVVPASGGTPAQTITTQVAISRDLLVAGNGNLGVTNASNNATNRDGRLSSGYNLVNMLARLDLKFGKDSAYGRRWPVALISNFVVNTQVRDVVAAGPGGTDLILHNDERYGFWGEVQVGRVKESGDWAFGYTLMRIQKDAVLTPFNFSDVTQQSDMRGHRFQFAYVAVPGKWIESEKKRQDSRVLIAITAIVTERPNGVLGPFLPTPPGSKSPASTRLQFDTILRF